MNKKALVLLVLLIVVIYYLNSPEKPSKSLMSSKPWIIPQTAKSTKLNSPKEPKAITVSSPGPKKEPTTKFPSDEPETDYSWLTDDNLEFILKQDPKTQAALKKANQTEKKFHLRTDIANIYNCFYKALSKQDWDLPEFLERLEDNKAQYTLFPLRVNGNHWGLVILSEEVEAELRSNGSSFNNERQEPMELGVIYAPRMVKLVTKVYYTSSGGGDLTKEKKQLQPFINQVVGGRTPITIIQPQDRNSQGYECGVYLCFYVREILEEGKLELKRKYSEQDCQEFRREWKERIGESWGKWD